MSGTSEHMAGETPMHSCRSGPTLQALLRLLLADDVDTAIEAGLMEFHPCVDCGRENPSYISQCAPVLEAQQRLRQAWAARDRYRARAARLARQAAERDARRAPAQAEKIAAALPPSAAAILARAKAKAAERRR